MSKYIGNTHVLVSEYACPHCRKLPPGFLDAQEDFEMALEYTVLFKGFEEIREKRGGTPLGIGRGGGYRCTDYERDVYEAWVKDGKRGAVHGFLSAHVFGLALDLMARDWLDHADIVDLARELRPRPRIGWRQYKQSGILMVHIDYGFLVTPCPTSDYISGVEW